MRRLLGVVAVVALIGVIGGGLGITRAQEASPEASAASLPPLLRAWADAYTAGDAAAVAALYTEDGVYEDVPSGRIARGREEIAGYLEQSVAQLPGLGVEPTAGYRGEGWAVVEYVFSATDAASGRPFSARATTVFELDGDLIRRSADYYDLLGVLFPDGPPPAAGTGTPAAGTSAP